MIRHAKLPVGNFPKPTTLSTMLALSTLIMAGPVHANGDAVNGEKIFKKCMACHTTAEKTNKAGPHFVGVVNRAVASVDNYKYSDAMIEYAASTKTWDEAALDVCLENPNAVVPKT